MQNKTSSGTLYIPVPGGGGEEKCFCVAFLGSVEAAEGCCHSTVWEQTVEDSFDHPQL